MTTWVFAFLIFTLSCTQKSPESEACREASLNDNNIFWAGLKHDTFAPEFRSPFGAVKFTQGNIRIRFQTCDNDVDSVRLLMWTERNRKARRIELKPEFRLFDLIGNKTLLWEYSLPLPQETNLIYYVFEIQNGSKTVLYVDQDKRAVSGGIGGATDSPRSQLKDTLAFEIAVYDPSFKVPEWTKGAVVYQIFPDRFRNGDPKNDPKDQSGWVYHKKLRKRAWTDNVCNYSSPNCSINPKDPDIDNVFYGGDLAGITQELKKIRELGVDVIYLNPIFESPSYHRYDTSNHKKIDPRLGTRKEFDLLIKTAKSLDIRIILDVVFNHVSSDSPYFDFYGRWDKKMQKTSKSLFGKNDASGACESASSPWRSWFFLPHFYSDALKADRKSKEYCPNFKVAGSKGHPLTYETWFNIASSPKINSRLKVVRDYFFQGGASSVVPFWMNAGISGWRLDVVADVDPGKIREPGNHFWSDFRKVVKAHNPDTWIVGEWWGDSKPWLLGQEWDTSMNYRLRSALLNWMFDSCDGLGCKGSSFSDNDSNEKSPIDVIYPFSESRFLDALKGIQESYPEDSWHSLMNVIGTHDTNRILFLLQMISGSNQTLAIRKLLFLYSFLMTYPGAPTIYYGDEVGLDTPGAWLKDGYLNDVWMDDPFSRAPYPWKDAGLKPNENIRDVVQKLGHLRQNHKALKKGSYSTVHVDDQARTLSFTRTYGDDLYLILFNRLETSQDIHLTASSDSMGSVRFYQVYPATNAKEALIYHSDKAGELLIRGVEGLSMRVLKKLK